MRASVFLFWGGRSVGFDEGIRGALSHEISFSASHSQKSNCCLPMQPHEGAT